ncbi:MAG: low molecular weight protein arginine phosphatase [Candidatus Omnitrophica bacterium]|nr:low molecular weight protein arginine phosphatase [Candidatus Omnitrophota bacterium]
MKILFVCTGNSCRSPMASVMLGKMAQDEGLDIDADSCGSEAFLGLKISREAADVLRREGMGRVEYKSKPLNKQLIEWADIILVMENRHKLRVIEESPGAERKTYLLTEFANSEIREIVDPIGKPLEVYEGLFMDLKFYLVKILERIKNESSSRQ